MYTDPNIDVTWSDCAHLIPADKNFVGGGGNGVSDLFFRFFFFIFEVSIFGFNGESDSESDEDELLWLINVYSLVFFLNFSRVKIPQKAKFVKIHDWAKFLEEAESESELELDEELEDELEDELETEEADLLPFLEIGFLTSSFRTFSSANSRFKNFMHESWIWVINCRFWRVIR